MEDMLRRTLGERVQLQTILTRDLWPALTDVNQFESAILNLAINARDAMPDGGRLTIETRNTRLDVDSARRHNDVTAGEYVVISVSDTGVGMPPDVADRAFEPFFTTKPIGLGTGLGLSMIYGFAKQSQGHLRISSEEGVGTTIRLYLARAYTDSDLPSITNAIETPRGEGETILVVEDDAAVRLLVTAVLQELGYSYLEASGAPEAMTILRSGARIDLLLTDVGLPIMNGRQLAEFARESRPEMKVLLVTGYAENATVRGGFLGRGMDMLTKPFALNVLGLKIKAIDRDRYRAGRQALNRPCSISLGMPAGSLRSRTRRAVARGPAALLDLRCARRPCQARSGRRNDQLPIEQRNRDYFQG